MESLVSLGKRIYNIKNKRELHRMMVFLIRSKIHYKGMRRLYKFFQKTPERKELIQANPFPLEQVTRAFFYNGATFDERSRLIQYHYEYLERVLSSYWIKYLSILDQKIEIWRYPDERVDWSAQLVFNAGQRKEGLLSVVMMLSGSPLYQIIFWINADKKREESLWIGAMQGPNMDDARELVKETTKWAHRYRTKNLILYMIMAVARSLRVKHIYAVSNEGYYAMNHIRRDRKLKTDFGEFWQEVGGHITEDSRFYEIPLTEQRKTMEEVPTRKRAVYRKRFAFQDDVDEQIAANMEKILK